MVVLERVKDVVLVVFGNAQHLDQGAVNGVRDRLAELCGAALSEVDLSNPQGWGWEALAYSAESRRRVTTVWNTLHPKVLAHGHIHVQDEVTLEDGRRVYSLGCDEQRGNLALLDPASLEWEWFDA
jgi:hypothetical protein